MTTSQFFKLHKSTFKATKESYCPDLKEVLSSFQNIPKKCIKDYNNLLDFLILFNRPYVELFNVLKELKADELQPDKSTAFAIVKGMCQQDQLEMAQEILELLRKEQNCISIGAYDILIKAHLRKAMVENFQKSQILGIRSSDLQTVSENVDKIAGVKKAAELALGLLEQPDAAAQVDIKLIRSFVYAHQKLENPLGCKTWIQFAHSLVDQFSDDKQQLTPLYNSLMDSYGRRGDDNAMITLLEQMKSSQYMQPNSYTYASIMKLLANKREYRLSDIISDVKSLSIKPTMELYNVMLRQQAIRGRVERVDNMLTKLVEQGMKLDTQAYNAVILARCSYMGINLNRVKLADVAQKQSKQSKTQQHAQLHRDIMSTYQEMQSSDARPNAFTINHVMMSLLYQGKADQLLKLFQQLESNLGSNKQPSIQRKFTLARHSDQDALLNTVSYNILMATLFSSRATKSEVFSVFRKITGGQHVEPDHQTLHLALLPAYDTVNVAQIEEIVKFMITKREKYGLFGSFIHDGSDLDRLLNSARRRIFGRLGAVQLVSDIDWLRSGKILSQSVWRPKGEIND